MFRVDERQRKWWILGAMGCVLGLVVLDETVLGVALPTLQRDLGMSQGASHWVVSSYVLIFTGLVVAGGRLGDIFGHHWFFVLGVAIFGVASLACGFAQSGTWLIAARIVQGVGAAIIFPGSVAMISAVFPPEERGLAYGIHTTFGAVFITMGPLVGGYFTEAISWRWIFWVNLPIVAIVGLVVLLAWREKPTERPRERIDFVGLVTLVAGLSALVTVLMEGDDWGWTAPNTLALLVAGCVSLAVFVRTELRIAEPLIDLPLLSIPTFAAANLTVFTANVNKFTNVIFGSIFMQQVLKLSPLTAGLVLAGAAAPTLFTSLLAGKLADRFTARSPALLGLAAHCIAMLGMTLAAYLESLWLLVAALVLWCTLMPFLYVPARRAAMNAIPPEHHGQGGGVNVTSQQLGGTVAIAVAGALLVGTGGFLWVFLAPALLSIAALAFAWRHLEHPSR